MRKTGPRRPPPARPDAERCAVEAIAAQEPRFEILYPANWPPAPGSCGAARGRGRGMSTSELSRRAWYALLCSAGVLQEELSHDERYVLGLRVPAWACDLARMASRFGQRPGSELHARAVRAVRRAVRTAARAPLFRAAIAAECDRVRGEVDGALLLLHWLEERDWGDARPGAAFPEAPPKT
jgi:hypothetical protein